LEKKLNNDEDDEYWFIRLDSDEGIAFEEEEKYDKQVRNEGREKLNKIQNNERK
jgi:hypothetical protein